MHPYASLFGELVGAILGGALFTYLFGLAAGLAFKNADPDERAVGAAIGGWLVVAIVAGLGYRNPLAGLFYVPGAFIGFLWLRGRYRKLWQPDTDELTNTFS